MRNRKKTPEWRQMMLINQNSYRHFSVPVVVAAYDGGVALEYGVKLGLELVQLVLV